MNPRQKGRNEKMSKERDVLADMNGASHQHEDKSGAIRIKSPNTRSTDRFITEMPAVSKGQETIRVYGGISGTARDTTGANVIPSVIDQAGRPDKKEVTKFSSRTHQPLHRSTADLAIDLLRSTGTVKSSETGKPPVKRPSVDPPESTARKPSRDESDHPNQVALPHNLHPAVAIGVPIPMICDIEGSECQPITCSERKEEEVSHDKDHLSHSTTSSTRCTVMASPRNDAIIVAPTLPVPDSHGEKPPGINFSLRVHHRALRIMREVLKYKVLKVLQILLAFYVGFLTYADIGPPGGLRDTETGLIIDQASEERTENGLIRVNGTDRPIVAATFYQVVCIGITRMSAFFMYPALVLVYISKLRATISFLSRTPLSMFMHGDVHELHIYCGWTIMIFSIIHTVFHLARWGQQGNLRLLFTHVSGITGLIIIVSCILICIPMMFFRKQVRYELRKNMHYLFLVFALALCFHTPTSAIPNGGFTAWVFGTILVWYFLDGAYCYLFMTEKIDTTKFHVLPSGVRMTMDVSKRFQKNGEQGGYCYICLPWVDKHQWHAFSLFENPSNPAERQIFMMRLGDWTNEVHHVLHRDTVRPAWVHGPFPSPYNSAEEYDNQILVASGIGITPALSVIRAHKKSRLINLIWCVRDKYLLEFFLHHLYLDNRGWNLIFYTGKEKLDATELNAFKDTNVCIISGRPIIADVIPNIVYGIESGLGLPERYSHDGKMIASEMIFDMLDGSSDEEECNISAKNRQAEHLSSYASELGFHLPPQVISQEIHGSHQEVSSCEPSEEFIPHRRRTSEAIMGHLSLGFRPWIKQDGAKEFVKNLDKKLVLSTWGILYCGGVKQLERDVRNVADEYEVDIHVESFDW